MSVFGNTSRLARIKEYWKGGTTKGESHVQDIKWLIGQAQLVEDLTKKRKSDAARNALIEKDRETFLNENIRLRAALDEIVEIAKHDGVSNKLDKCYVVAREALDWYS